MDHSSEESNNHFEVANDLNLGAVEEKTARLDQLVAEISSGLQAEVNSPAYYQAVNKFDDLNSNNPADAYQVLDRIIDGGEGNIMDVLPIFYRTNKGNNEIISQKAFNSDNENFKLAALKAWDQLMVPLTHAEQIREALHNTAFQSVSELAAGMIEQDARALAEFKNDLLGIISGETPSLLNEYYKKNILQTLFHQKLIDQETFHKLGGRSENSLKKDQILGWRNGIESHADEIRQILASDNLGEISAVLHILAEKTPSQFMTDLITLYDRKIGPEVNEVIFDILDHLGGASQEFFDQRGLQRVVPNLLSGESEQVDSLPTTKSGGIWNRIQKVFRRSK